MRDIKLLRREIKHGNVYLQQSEDLRKLMKKVQPIDFFLTLLFNLDGQKTKC